MKFSDNDICFLVKEYGMVEPFDEQLLGPASLDVRVGTTLLEEVFALDSKGYPSTASYNLHEGIQWRECKYFSYCTADDPYWLHPQEFVLVATAERFNIPIHVCATFALKSSRAREGYGHALAAFCDPGWTGSVLTMEIFSHARQAKIPLYPGMLIGQMLFEPMHSEPSKSYATIGHYNGDRAVQSSKIGLTASEEVCYTHE